MPKRSGNLTETGKAKDLSSLADVYDTLLEDRAQAGDPSAKHRLKVRQDQKATGGRLERVTDPFRDVPKKKLPQGAEELRADALARRMEVSADTVSANPGIVSKQKKNDLKIELNLKKHAQSPDTQAADSEIKELKGAAAEILAKEKEKTGKLWEMLDPENKANIEDRQAASQQLLEHYDHELQIAKQHNYEEDVEAYEEIKSEISRKLEECRRAMEDESITQVVDSNDFEKMIELVQARKLDLFELKHVHRKARVSGRYDVAVTAQEQIIAGYEERILSAPANEKKGLEILKIQAMALWEMDYQQKETIDARNVRLAIIDNESAAADKRLAAVNEELAYLEERLKGRQQSKATRELREEQAALLQLQDELNPKPKSQVEVGVPQPPSNEPEMETIIADQDMAAISDLIDEPQIEKKKEFEPLIDPDQLSEIVKIAFSPVTKPAERVKAFEQLIANTKNEMTRPDLALEDRRTFEVALAGWEKMRAELSAALPQAPAWSRLWPREDFSDLAEYDKYQSRAGTEETEVRSAQVETETLDAEGLLERERNFVDSEMQLWEENRSRILKEVYPTMSDEEIRTDIAQFKSLERQELIRKIKS